MRFTFERTVIVMLFSKFILVGVMLSLVLFLILQQEAQQQLVQQRANQTEAFLVNKIFNKLDLLHNQSNQVINAQGNISSAQRQAILKDFTDIEIEGGLATKNGQAANNHMLKEILGNVSEIANKSR